jgi:hypothetical protein
MDQELDVLLDVLESGDTLRFRQMVENSHWNWFIPYFDGKAGVISSYVRLDGPLKLAVELSALLHQLSEYALESPGYTLVVGDLRKVLEEFHKIPSMKNIGLTSAQYVKQVVGIAKYGDYSNVTNPVHTPRLMASYLLSSVDTSWCLIRGAHDTTIENVVWGPIIGHVSTAGTKYLLWLEVGHTVTQAAPPPLYDVGTVTESPLTQLGSYWARVNADDGATRADETHSAEVMVRLTTEKAGGIVQDRPEVLRFDVEENAFWHPYGTRYPEETLKESVFSRYLPYDFMVFLHSLLAGIGAYVDWHMLKGNKDPMPSQMKPSPPTWLSVWKDVA